jgi:hypothetical protein
LKRSSWLLLNVVAAIIYLSAGWASGLLLHVHSSVFSSQDSQEYHQVADWIFGARTSAAASNWRPFLYPLLIGLGGRLGGVYGVWLLNVVLWFTALNVAAGATYRFVKSNLAAALVFLVLATNLSLIVLTFEGLTEITTVALLACWIFGVTYFSRRSTPAQVAWILLPVTLLVVVKPEFELLLAIVVVVALVGIVRSQSRALAAAVFAMCLIPVAIQLALMVRFNGYLGISRIGDTTVREYFLSQLDVTIGQAANLQQARQQMDGLSDLGAARFLLNHFGDAAVVFASTLSGNLISGTSFLDGHPHIRFAILATQLMYFAVLIVMIPVVSLALWRAHDGRLALLYVGSLNVFLAGGLTFSQGDRITIVALPLWLTAFVLAVKEAGRLEVGSRVEARTDPGPRVMTDQAEPGPTEAPTTNSSGGPGQ